MEHTITQVVLDDSNLNAICEEHNVFVVAYRNIHSNYDTYAIMAVNEARWVMPSVVNEYPTLQDVEYGLIDIQRGAAMVEKLNIVCTNAKKLMRIGHDVYMMIDSIIYYD